LKLEFRSNGSGSVIADWTPSKAWEGFQGIIHGGIVSTVLDEAMSKAVAAAGAPALTCHLEVRLRRHVAAGEPMRVHGWVVERRRRRIQTEAELRDRLDVERAHAWATFLEVHTDRRPSPRAEQREDTGA
jgi:acyl-coenzyme A thioesterase PaaI-like protein